MRFRLSLHTWYATMTARATVDDEADCFRTTRTWSHPPQDRPRATTLWNLHCGIFTGMGDGKGLSFSCKPRHDRCSRLSCCCPVRCCVHSPLSYSDLYLVIPTVIFHIHSWIFSAERTQRDIQPLGVLHEWWRTGQIHGYFGCFRAGLDVRDSAFGHKHVASTIFAHRL